MLKLPESPTLPAAQCQAISSLSPCAHLQPAAMASLAFEASFDFVADHEVTKMMRATARATNLHIKRTELARARSARDWTWGRGIEGARPHHSVRAAARTCLAKGVVESQEDMPSIVRMGLTETKGARRKPAVAHMVHAKVADWKLADARFDLDEAETTADEGSEGSETESPEASPLCGPEAAPRELAAELGAWPALPSAAAEAPAAASASRPSHREVARRFVEESLEERAAAERSRAKETAAARAAREASMWRPSWSRRRQRLLAARRAQRQAKARAVPPPARGDAPPAAASLDFEADLGDVKMARAAARHEKLRIKRSELSRARDARDWTWGRGIEGARPHHSVRAAARTCLARGVVESQEDMPSIVHMSKPGDKGARRKPAVAHAV